MEHFRTAGFSGLSPIASYGIMRHPDLRDQITATLKTLPEGGHFSFVSPFGFEPLMRRIQERFLERGVLDAKRAWWWECLKGDSFSFSPPNPIAVVENLLRKDEDYWFIASEEGSGPNWLCDASGGRLVEVLRKFSAFQYYVVEKKLAWMLGENHHGVVFAVGDGMPARLRELALSLA